MEIGILPCSPFNVNADSDRKSAENLKATMRNNQLQLQYILVYLHLTKIMEIFEVRHEK